MLALLSELILNRCVNPPGNEMRSIKSIELYLLEKGIKSRVYETAPDRGNLAARISGSGDGPTLMFGPSHVDVVPVVNVEAWDVDPFAATVRDGYLPEELRPETRRKFKAYDGVNNAFNLAYTLLKWRVHRALFGAKLEPYLGFVHFEQHGKPSLVCDFMELYRYLVDDFLVGFLGTVGKRDFVMKDERTTRKRRGKREYLNGSKMRELVRGLDDLFEGWVEVPRIRHGYRQTLETLINEEAQLLAKYLRDERKSWIPRITGASMNYGSNFLKYVEIHYAR